MAFLDDSHFSAFRTVPRAGVIFVTTEAARLGYKTTDHSWCNLGQGQRESGPRPGAPACVHSVSIDMDDQEYAPERVGCEVGT